MKNVAKKILLSFALLLGSFLIDNNTQEVYNLSGIEDFPTIDSIELKEEL